jgi:hypothetical protein
MNRPFRNDEPARPVAPEARPPNRYDYQRDAKWKGNHLFFRGRIVASIFRDVRYPGMYRVGLPNGHMSDMMNLTRAKDAALTLAYANAATQIERGA